MFWKGDTLVYDATAFKLPDGSMLDAFGLLHQPLQHPICLRRPGPHHRSLPHYVMVHLVFHWNRNLDSLSMGEEVPDVTAAAWKAWFSSLRLSPHGARGCQAIRQPVCS